MKYDDFIKSNPKNMIELHIDKDLYNKKTVFRTCYKFTDKVYVYIQSNENQFVIYFTKKDPNYAIEDISKEFTNELLDQELRQLVLEDTQKVRDAIVARALLSGQSNAI